MALRRVSVIVPTLNEELTISATLEDIGRLGPHEVIVVDGGSGDSTRDLAGARSTLLLVETGGLARQLNRGAGAATGDALLFHFADLRLPAGALEAVGEALGTEGVVGGAFRLGLDSPRWIYRLIAVGANLRNRFGFGPFGDQAIFVSREAFERLGGFSPVAALEDLDLVRRLRRIGRFVILARSVRSSVRRWERDGVVRTSLAHFWTSLLFLLGARKLAGRLKRRLQRRRAHVPEICPRKGVAETPK